MPTIGSQFRSQAFTRQTAIRVWLLMAIIVVIIWTSAWLDEHVLSMLIFASIQLFSLAIIGEYLGRVYMQTKQRPLFIIRQIVAAPSANERHSTRLGELIDDV